LDNNDCADLTHVLQRAQIKIEGDLSKFKQNNKIGKIEGGQKLINDGNTLIYHFWDETNNYVLLHEIKYES